MAAPAAEIALRQKCECTAAVVTLGDVAEIVSADRRRADELAAVELFPAPLSGRQRFVRLREIQDLLMLRGINLAEHRFSGSSRVVVSRSGGSTRADRAGREKPLSVSIRKRARRLACEAVVRYLEQYAAESEPWIVQVELDEDQVRLVSAAGERITVSGGGLPWVGEQRFEFSVDTPGGPARFAVRAQVTLPPAVVVATRALPRGTIVNASDVRTQRDAPLDTQAECFGTIEEVVGRQTTRMIAVGKAIEREWVRAPLLVRRGEIVTVLARASGITVSTNARAHDDGSEGELVAVESLHDRGKFFARVCGLREVEVYARAMRSSRSGPSKPH